ncbi:MAG: phage portal protein [Thauera sp.]|jgi:HK97 family phage portal protein|nr:phage portal protein [Thauera sp.]
MSIEKRSMASSEVLLSKTPDAQWTKWSVRKGVSEGYQYNGWVFRAISIIANAASSVPWAVFGDDNEIIWDHPVSQVLRNPNPHWTRQQLFEVIVCWLMLTGNAYLYRVNPQGQTKELWPVSPDRIAPIPSADIGKWIEGYEEIDEKGIKRRSQTYKPENVTHIRLMNPANPYVGISPLGAAAMAVDLDNAQRSWNTATMQNRGVPDGVFSFKQPIDEIQSKSLVERLKERFYGPKRARTPIVLGSDATYQRMSLTPVEMDFLQSRKFNREEIAAIYGVPPQLMASEAASTYNNFSSAIRVLWESAILPLLDNIRDCLQTSFKDELSEGLTIGPDLTNVRALQESEDERAKVAKLYVEMGVPFSQVNERFELGFEEWEGWDKPRQAAPRIAAKQAEEGEEEGRKWALKPLELRSPESEAEARDRYAEDVLQPVFADLLKQQQDDVFAALERGEDPADAAKKTREAWRKAMEAAYINGATQAAAELLDSVRGKSPVVELRATPQDQDGQYSPELMEQIRMALEAEGVILRDLSLIDDTTVQMIIEQIAYGLDHEATTAMIQQAIIDSGTFSAERALRIARTTAGSAMSIGQLTAGVMAGAEFKTWNTGGLNVREEHLRRDGETVGINDRFSAQFAGAGPRFPCDPETHKSDRINCRCFLSFE